MGGTTRTSRPIGDEGVFFISYINKGKGDVYVKGDLLYYNPDLLS